MPLMSHRREKGVVYMIPLPLSEGANQTLPAEVFSKTAVLRHYFVENARTARRFLRSMHASLILEEIEFSEISKHEGADVTLFKKWINSGFQIGVMSEAGCPGIADPGSKLAGIAHSMEAKVVPLSGPSSIVLALMASGLNGQSFAFHGYLPLKEPARGRKIKELEALSAKENQTQVFIETPYRNNQMIADLIRHCHPRTKLCVAMGITSEHEFIVTKSLSEWKHMPRFEEKVPAVFLISG